MPQARRAYIKLTEEQRAQMRLLRQQLDAEKPEILANGRAAKQKIEQMESQLRNILKVLRDEREAQGLSLSDMHERTGMTRESLCRLETSPTANPTIATIERYAEALGRRVTIQLEPLT